jgi:hypothetical protein
MDNQIIPSQTIVKIDRSIPFDVTSFLGDGWVVEEEDEWSLRLTEIHLNRVVFKTMLEPSEKFITGEKRLSRLKCLEYVRLDANILKTLLENSSLIPESFKDKIFDGTVVSGGAGRERFVFCLDHNEEEGWHYHRVGLSQVLRADDPSAILQIIRF